MDLTVQSRAMSSSRKRSRSSSIGDANDVVTTINSSSGNSSSRSNSGSRSGRHSSRMVFEHVICSLPGRSTSRLTEEVLRGREIAGLPDGVSEEYVRWVLASVADYYNSCHVVCPSERP